MFGDFRKVRVFLKPGPTDMRKAINGLSQLAEDFPDKDIFSGNLYIFCNRRRDQLKILYWDRNGFCLWQKRLESHKFPWPQTEAACQEITRTQLKWLLTGIDFFNAHKTLKFGEVA